jgi:polysaccharide pyruvyl transferase WcaK-like protein
MVHKESGKMIIGILAHVGQGNLGDEAICAAVVENIRSLVPEAEFVAFTCNPEDTFARHKVRSFPVRKEFVKIGGTKKLSINEKEKRLVDSEWCSAFGWAKKRIRKSAFLWRILKAFQGLAVMVCNWPGEAGFVWESYKKLRGLDLLIVAGSQQLIDYVGGPWGFPFTLYKWSFLAKICGAKVCFASVGAGPFVTKLGMYFAKSALKRSGYRSYRDETSREWIKKLGLGDDEIRVCPDLAFGLELPVQKMTTDHPIKERIVGINPIPFYDENYWEGASARAYEGFISTLADFSLWLMERKYKVTLFPTQLVLDLPVIDDIERLVMGRGNGDASGMLQKSKVSSIDDLVGNISEMTVAVTSRYHGAVLSYAVGKPVLGIAYQQKTADLMREMGEESYALDIRGLKLTQMQDRFKRLEDDIERITERIMAQRMAFRKALSAQYERILELARDQE